MEGQSPQIKRAPIGRLDQKFLLDWFFWNLAGTICGLYILGLVLDFSDQDAVQNVP